MPYITTEDLEDARAALRGRRGHFTSAGLYEDYEISQRRRGRPISHPVRFGQILREYGAARKQKWDPDKGEAGQMVKGWVVTSDRDRRG